MTSTDFSSLPPEPPLARFALPFLALALGGMFLAGRHPMAPAGLTALTAIFGLGYLPGLALTLPVERRFGLWAGWVLPLILSPLLVSGICLILAYFNVSLMATCSWIVVGAVGIICLTPPPQRELEDRALTVDAPGFLQKRSDRGQVLLLAGFVLAILAVMFLGRASAFTQDSAVVQAALVENTFYHLPPQDPLLAGLPYRGAWAWPLYLGVLSHATGLDPGFLLVVGSLVSAFTLVFVAYRCLGSLGLDHSRSIWGTIFLFFALAPPAWHWLSPESTGGDAFFLGTFLTPGGHWMGWVYSILAFWGTTAFLRDSRRGLWWAFLAYVGLWLFDPSLGALWSLLLLVSVPAGWIVCRISPWKREGLSMLVAGVMGWAACFVVYPYLKSTSALGPVPVEGFMNFSLAQYGRILSALHWEVVLGMAALFVFLAAKGLRQQLWAVWGVLTITMGFGATFGPPGVEYAGHLLLAPTLGSLVPWVWRKVPRLQTAIVILLMVLMVPATGLGLAAFFHPDQSLQDQDLITWIENETPAEAVFLTLDSMNVLRAQRQVFYDHDHVMRRGHNAEEITRRRTTHFAVLLGAEVQLLHLETLEALGVPVYWIDTESAEAHPPWTLQEELGSTSVYLWDPPAP